jgi:hypothetical protein
MKFKLKDKTLVANPATLRQIHTLEKNIGNIAELSEKAPFDSIIKVIEVIIDSQPQEEGMTIDFVLDNCSMEDFAKLNEVVSHFLGVQLAEAT